MQMSFGSLELRQRLRQDSVLMKIDALIDWEELRSKLTGLYKRELSNGGGQEPFDVLMTFKAILLWVSGIVCRMPRWSKHCVYALIFYNFVVCPCWMRYRTKPPCAVFVTAWWSTTGGWSSSFYQ